MPPVVPELGVVWYETAGGVRTSREELEALEPAEVCAAVRAMIKRRQQGRVPALSDRKVLPGIWELRIPYDKRAFRVLYTLIQIGELRRGMLILTVYEKKSAKLPESVKETTLARLADQRQRRQDPPNG